MRENSATQKSEHPSVSYRCPFCGAEPGAPCRAHRGRGQELDFPHSRRIHLARDPRPTTPPRQALCCECGTLRTYRHGRNQRGRWGDLNWHRNVCDLKCSTCGRVTTHATVPNTARDDTYELIARGRDPRSSDRGSHWSEEKLRRIQQQYRRGLPRNPYLAHRYWGDDAQAAAEAGGTHASALCGEAIPIQLDERTGGVYYYVGRPEPGCGWEEVECVDCLRIANDHRRYREHKQLQKSALKLYVALMDSAFQVGDGDRSLLLENIRKLLP
jgi:hypothetical protein